MPSQQCRSISLNLLLAINSKHGCVLLDKDVCDVIARLQLRREVIVPGNTTTAELMQLKPSRDVISQLFSPRRGNSHHYRQPCIYNVNNDRLFVSCSERCSAVLRTVHRHHTVPSSTPRHAGPRTNFVNFATWNIQSVNNKVDDVCHVMSQSRLDVITLTEKWHEDSDS